MAPDLILVVAGLSAAWAFFSIIGGERQRVLQNAELARRTASASSDPQTTTKPAALPIATPPSK